MKNWIVSSLGAETIQGEETIWGNMVCINRKLKDKTYLKSHVVGKYFFTESTVIDIVSIMNIQMYFDLSFFSKHFSTRQAHEFGFPHARLNHWRCFEAHIALFNIPTVCNGTTKINVLTQMFDQNLLWRLFRIAKATSVADLRLCYRRRRLRGSLWIKKYFSDHFFCFWFVNY